MLKVGITGGIGTGKSTVCAIFSVLNIPIFNADVEAKRLYTTNSVLKEAIKKNFGANIYENEIFHKDRLAQIVFSNAEKLRSLNELVHPLVIEQGQKWFEAQTATYALKEAALMIESNSHKHLDKLIVVQSPLTTRIERIKKRDKVEEAKIIERINKQMPEEEKSSFADYTIYNSEEQALIPQVLQIHKKLLTL